MNNMMLLVFSFFFNVPMVSSGCHNDTNKDHRPRVSCPNQGVSEVPGDIHARVEILVLSENQFLSLSWFSYSQFSQLYELNLNHNLITSVQSAGPLMEKLHVLRLSSNKLSILGPKAFSPAPNLMEIYLDRNGLRVLDELTFSDLPYLEVINLSQNEIHILPARLLQFISSVTLKTFDLESNHVQHLPDRFFISKPELPYVYLSQNPWVCTCLVAYLQRFLEDQGHNVYRHTGPTSIENDPESVVCATPAELQDRAIVDLKQNEYCRQDRMSSFRDTYPDPAVKSVNTESATVETVIQSVAWTTATPTTTKTTMGISTLPTIPMSANPTTALTTPPIVTGLVIPNKTLLNTPETTKLFNTSSTTTIQMIVNTTPHKWSWTMFYVWPFRSEHYLTTTQGTFLASTKDTTYLEFPKLPLSISPSTTALPVLSSAYSGSQRSVPWCWWLFITFLMLNIFSVIFSCLLLLWLIHTYIRLYRPIRQQIFITREKEAVTLMRYKVKKKANSSKNLELQEKMVPFLPPTMIREVQPVFRSILFISKQVEDRDAKTGNSICEVKDEINPVSSLPLRRGGEEALRDREEVFRKTLYRVISREEEIIGWKEVEDSCWGIAQGSGEWPGLAQDTGVVQGEEQGKMRYSLILREERQGMVRDSKSEVEWLMGEWETDRDKKAKIEWKGCGSVVKKNGKVEPS